MTGPKIAILLVALYLIGFITVACVGHSLADVSERTERITLVLAGQCPPDTYPVIKRFGRKVVDAWCERDIGVRY